jgi:NAD(P)-dependent dehydrogenase (short-subunit alcohol dehydrogenase family)
VVRFAVDVGERFGRLDVLANSAGADPSNSLEDTTVADWDLTMDVNVKGAMLMSEASVPFRRAQGSGRIVNISSRTYLGSVTNPGYVSSNAAIGVRSNAVAPSLTSIGGRASLLILDPG